ncbi:unnamed protein product, partial [Brenthis ino]
MAINKLPSKSGLFYQPLGDILISESSWKLVIFRNLEPLFLSRDSLKRLIANYETVISSSKYITPSIYTTKSFTKVSLDKIDTRLNELSYYTNNHNRAKRELIDGLGTVLKWLIGTPDAKDAQYYNQCIELLEKQQLDHNQVLTQQLQIISSTISNFNDTISRISYDEYSMNDNLNRISSYLNTTNKIIFDLKVSEEISTVSIQILESVLSLERELDEIITSILFIKSGAIHPSIISTIKLYKELLATNHLRINNNLVAPITLGNIHKILESTTPTSYIYLNKLIYILEFPLVKNEKFNLYHMYSIPIKHYNSSYYSTLFPEHTYLATSTTLQRYVTTSILESCKMFTTKTRVCKDLPVYNYNARPICEIAILQSSSKEPPSNCELTTFSAHVDTFQSIGNNQWIFLLRFKTPSIVECGNQIEHQEISGSGIISLKSGCKFYTAFVTLNAEEDTMTNLTYPIITVDIEDACLPETLRQPIPPELHPIMVKNVPLDSLHIIKEQIKVQEQLLKEQQNSFNSNFSSPKFSFTAMALGSSMLIFLLYKCCPWHYFWTRNRNPRDLQPKSGCIQIFNNCFDNSRQRQSIPLATINTSALSEDEDEDENLPTTARSRTPKARSLF